MSTSAVNTSSSSAASAAAAANAQGQQQLSKNYTEFLQLLTTSLQNQDPTNPTDTNQLTQEIAQLSQVQGQLQTNTDLAQLISLVSSQMNSNAVSYIGRQIDASGSPAQTELTSSQASLVYNLASTASKVTITITNSAGQTIFSGPATTVVGRNQVEWNGQTNTGTTAPDGTYNFTVTATDSSGAAVTATPVTTGVVQAVDTQNGTTTLSLGGSLSVPLNNVQAVYNEGTNPGS
jgi:flagellar basal-body rod modification protein FlgD